MTVPLSLVASTLAAPLIDGPCQQLQPAHRSRHAWHLETAAGHVVASLVTPQAVRLPHSLVVDALPSEPPPISVGDGALGWGTARLRPGRWFTPARPRHPALSARLRDRAAIARSTAGWSARLGLGDGLTPYADDVICGSLVALHAVDHPGFAPWAAQVRRAPLERRTTALSAGLLRLAAEGWCIDPMARVLAAVAHGRGIPAAVEDLVAVGHSSGRGMLDGMARVLVLDEVLEAA